MKPSLRLAGLRANQQGHGSVATIEIGHLKHYHLAVDRMENRLDWRRSAAGGNREVLLPPSPLS